MHALCIPSLRGRYSPVDIRELRPDRFGDNRVLLHDKKLGEREASCLTQIAKAALTTSRHARHLVQPEN